MDNASILVTGGCGQAGSHIIEKLLEAYPKARISAMSRNPTINTFPGVTYHKADVSSPSDIARVMAATKPSVVFHVAGVLTASTTRGHVPDKVTRAINYDGAVFMLEASQRAGVKAFIFTSSASVVMKEDGGFKDLFKADETYPICEWDDGANAYARAKAQAEKRILEADDPSGMRTTSLRPAIIHGERDADIIPSMLASLRAGRTRIQLGDNSNHISVTYAGNCADAHLLAAQKLLSANSAEANLVGGEAFFITNDDDPAFWTFMRGVWAAAGTEVRVEDVRVVNGTVALWMAWAGEWWAWLSGGRPSITQPLVRFSQMNRTYDITKARERLGYVPKVGNKEGLRRGVKWVLENEKKQSK